MGSKPKGPKPGLDETWMWHRAQELLEEADRMQRSFFQLAGPGADRASWAPPADVFETSTEVWVIVALPGVQLEHLELTLERCALVVRGSRQLPDALRRAAVHRLEIPHGRFMRRIELPPERTYELGQQELTNGCLAVSLQKIG